MTRKEAIKHGKEQLEVFGGTHREFIEMAIKALEQEPCEDAISRQAALVSIKNLYPDMPIVDIFGARRKWLEKYAPYFECENAIEQLPSVRSQYTDDELQKMQEMEQTEIQKAYELGKEDKIKILDKIKAEIEHVIDNTYDSTDHDKSLYNGAYKDGLYDALDIIDKYKSESEDINCGWSDAEIAKSFIEDVEAVKDLLPQAESEG